MEEEYTAKDLANYNEMEALKSQLSELDFPREAEKLDVFKLLKHIIDTKDTTKVGNVDKEELRVVRLEKDISSYAKVWGFDDISNYFGQEAEIILASSTSKDGFLDQLAVTQRRQFETKSKTKQSQGGGFKQWFKKKEEVQVEEQ